MVSAVPALAFTRTGSGAPLVLLHGLGSSRAAWDSVVPALAERFDVIAVDLPGFGDSDPLPPGVIAAPAVLAASVAALLDGLGHDAPHLVGNSLGGWVALELAQLRPTASVTLLSPAGLWRAGAPRYGLVSLRLSRWLAVHAARPLRWVVGSRVGRTLVLGQTHGRPWRMDAERARLVLHAMASCPGFRSALEATAAQHISARSVEAPVTVAFGTRDWLLLKWQSRRLDQLPATVRIRELRGCGHVPMTDDPAAVVEVITEASRRVVEVG